MRAIENLSRTARATRERCQPVLFPMVEPDLISTLEHYLVAPSFEVSLYEQTVPNWRWQSRIVCGHLVRSRRHYSVFELFLRGNSTALYVAHDVTYLILNIDSPLCNLFLCIISCACAT